MSSERINDTVLELIVLEIISKTNRGETSSGGIENIPISRIIRIEMMEVQA